MRIGRSIAVGALALGVLPIGVASGVRAAAAPAVAQDISFDGYCDGLHINIPSAGLGVAGTVDGTTTGDCADPIGLFGEASPNRFGKFGVTKGNEYVQYEDPAISVFTVVKKDHTWTHYVLDAGHLLVLNFGTWSLGTGASTVGRVSSMSAAAKPQAADLLAPDGRIDIAFTGHCDGMRLRIPSAGLGRAGTIDGKSTGCETEPVMGAVATINGQGDWVTGVVDGGTVPLQYAILADGTWVLYRVSGGVISVFSAGAWTYGTPVAQGVSSRG
jgi:hypothetical protein